MTISVRPLTGTEMADAIPALAALRIAVFADWPYLYDGDAGYEEEYLRAFVAAPDACLVAAFDGDQIVGAATASPLAAQAAAIRHPFDARGMDATAFFYFGESVLQPAFRGQGVGHAFFDLREAHALACGATTTTFAAVARPDAHPDRPLDYTPLNAFWRKRGYAPVDGLVTELVWKDHRDTDETSKPMHFWMRLF